MTKLLLLLENFLKLHYVQNLKNQILFHFTTKIHICIGKPLFSQFTNFFQTDFLIYKSIFIYLLSNNIYTNSHIGLIKKVSCIAQLIAQLTIHVKSIFIGISKGFNKV